jgi:glycosyltransferase involved in cell wall biosynthesis
MKILWLTWRDRKHPLAGGAEVVNEELAKRLVQDGNEVILFAGVFPGALSEEMVDGYKIIRRGNRFTVYWQAFRYYRKHLRQWPDLVIDEVNTIPFFAKYYAKQPVILFVHQLARKIWFHQIMFPISLMGYLLEPIYLWLLSGSQTITISQSTKTDLLRFGFKKHNIAVVPIGINLAPIDDLSGAKAVDPTILSFGTIRKMKRTDQVVKAFNLAKQEMPELKLVVAGRIVDGYGKTVARLIETSPYKDSITLHSGNITEEHKINLMQTAHVFAVTSLKEGWCITVTEAASQGTPAVVYNVDGLRDSVKHNETGLISLSNTPEELSNNIIALLRDAQKHNQLRQQAHEWSKQFTFDNSHEQFKQVIAQILGHE